MDYHTFRTGLTFREVLRQLVDESFAYQQRTGERMYITRHTVLGRWHQLKQELWEQYQRCAAQSGD